MPSLEITTVIGCPLMCTLCPQDELKNAYQSDIKTLSFNNFKTVIDKLPHYVRIDFSGMSEPWVNKECTKMLEYALQQNRIVMIYSTLYGMTKEDTDQLIKLIHNYKEQIKTFCIHLPDKNGNMRGWKYSDEYEYAVESLLNLKEDIKTKIKFQSMTMDRNGQPSSLLDKFNFYKYHPDFAKSWTGHTRAGSLNITEKNKDFIYKNPEHISPVSCASTPFYDHNVLLPNGDVVLCCMDYSLKHIIGNLLEQTYEELYMSNEMLNVVKENKKIGFSKCSLCKSCDNVKIYGIEPNYYQWINS